MLKPGVQGVLEERQHLDGDVVTRILADVGHDAATERNL